MVFKIVILLALNSTVLGALAESTSPARVSTLDAADLVEYSSAPPAVQHLIDEGLRLTKQNLSYQYGSDDPSAGGMDCSGTIHYLLEQAGLKDVPRDSSDFYVWVWQQGHFQAVVSSNPKTFELARLKPGDLMFWTGTYNITRDPPITHVMIYLGTSRLTGRRVMVGASDGRTFNGEPRYGVSVFDFKMPTGVDRANGDTGSRFIGYGAIPGIESAVVPSAKDL
jgi:hypothetical protein